MMKRLPEFNDLVSECQELQDQFDDWDNGRTWTTGPFRAERIGHRMGPS
jgi:hypothetical protein